MRVCQFRHFGVGGFILQGLARIAQIREVRAKGEAQLTDIKSVSHTLCHCALTVSVTIVDFDTVPETAVTTYIIAALLSGVALLMSQVTLEWALATICGTLSAACLMAYLLMKVDMRS